MKRFLFALIAAAALLALAQSALAGVENPDTINGGWVKKFNTAGDSCSAFYAFCSKVGTTGAPSSYVYACGNARHYSGGLCSMAVACYNYYGALSWSRHYGIQSSSINGCWHAYGDTLWVTGYSNGSAYWQTYKINSATGDTLEGKRLYLASNSYGNGIMGDNARHIYAVGQKYNGTNYDACLIKYRDSLGVLDTVWTRTWNGDSSLTDYGYGVLVYGSNEIYITGKSNRGTGRGYDAFVARYDANGNLIYSKTYDNLTTGGYSEQGSYITRADTFLYISGSWSTPTTYGDMCVLKVRRGDGALLNNWSWSSGTSGTENGYQLFVADNPNTWGVVTGSLWTGSMYKMTTIKFNKTTGDTIWKRYVTGPTGSNGLAGASYGLDNAYIIGTDNTAPTTAKIVHYKWLLPQPTLVQPVDSFNTLATITFKWRNQTDIDTFRIQISKDTLFSAGGMVVDSLRTTNAPDTQFIFTPTADDTFYWRVKGYDYNGITQIDSTYWSDRHWVIEDRVSPGIGSSVLADGGKPSPWSGDTIFSINYTPTAGGMSGIRRALFKYGTAPTAVYDTSGTSVSKPFDVHSSLVRQKLFVWLQDSAGNVNHLLRDSVWLRYDNTIPGKVTAITADGANPAPWNNTGYFSINFTSPIDTSGINRHFAKVGGTPTSAGDTVAAWKFSSTPYTGPDGIYGRRWLHIWEQDGAGNVGWMAPNRDSVLLRYDNVAPDKPTSITTWEPNWRNTPAFDVIVGIPVDSSGIMRHYYKLGSSPTGPNDTTKTQPYNPAYPGHFETAPAQGIQWCYTWLADSAGNKSHLNRDSIQSKYDTTAPPAPVTLTANGGSPSPWTTNNTFIINVTFPHVDISGVKRYFAKLGSPPVNSMDTTQTYPAGSFTVSSSKIGVCSLYVWAQDSASNVSHLNRRSVALRYEGMAPVVNVTSPLAGYSWECGSGKTITWTQVDSGVVARDSVQYSIDGRATWNLIYSGPAGTANGWTVPNTPSTNCDIRVWAKDSVDLWSYGLSGTFSIIDTTKPAVTVNVPAGGQTWYCGANQTMSWTYTDNCGVAGDSIFYTTDNGASWTFIAAQVPAQGLYAWTVPPTPSTQSRVRVKVWDASGNWRTDASAGVFTIADSTKPTVTVTSPAGGESWSYGSNQTITWSQSDNAGVAQDSLLYSMDNGVSWTYIAKISATTAYAWTLPGTFSKQARVKVVAIDASGNKQESISNLFFISDPTAPTVAVNVPNGGENWQALSNQMISWVQSDNFGVVTDSIYYTTNGTTWTPVWGGSATTSYIWSVPNPPSPTCLVKVVAIDGYGNRTEDASNANFVITASSINITVTSPNGGQSYAPNAAVSITWTQSANVTSDTVKLSTDGGGTWATLWGGAAATSYGWTVPNTPSAQCRIKVIAVENASNAASDISDANFTIMDIDAPALAVTAPNGGESWLAGSTQTITWSQSDNVGVLGDSLWYTMDGGGSWTLLYAGAPKTSHSWVLPLTTSAACRVRVAAWDASGNRTVDESNGAFTIMDNVLPTVNLQYPIGGETFGIGGSVAVSWTQNDNIGVTIDSLEFSADSGLTHSLLWTGLGTNYNWTVPNSPSTKCMMRVLARDGAGNFAESYSSLFTIIDNSKPVVTLTAPLGGETWYCGGSQNITWLQTDNVGITVDSVFYSINDGASWTALYGGSATTGYSWAVPNINTTAARVLVKGYDAAGNLGADTSGQFAISDSTKPTAAVSQPNGGESMIGGSSYSVVWSRGDNLGITMDSLDYSTDNGASWSFVWKGVKSGGVGIHNWTVPNTPSTLCLMKVTVKDSAGNAATDISDAVFTITAATQPYLSVSPDSISLASGGGGDSIAVTNTGNETVINYTVSTDSSWITLSRASGATPGGFRITASPNASGFNRTGYVTVAATGIPGSPQLIKVVQPTQDVTAPIVAVTAPNGWEIWDIGTDHGIAWTQSDNVGVVLDSILYSVNNGSTWTYINSGTFPTSSFTWTVPGTPTASARVKVVARDAAGNRSEDVSDTVFTIRDNTAPVLTITQPTAGATWYAGTTRNITWTQGDNIGVTGDSVSYSGGGGVWSAIYAGAPTTSCSWALPNIHTASCTVKVVARDAAGNRTIQTVQISVLDTIKPVITVTAPNGGETYGIGVTVNVGWNHSDNIRVMSDSLYYSVDSGLTWNAGPEVFGANSYNWTVPNNPSTKCLVRMVAIDTAGNKASDISNGTFTISAATSPYLAVNRDTVAAGWAGSGFDVNVTNTGNGAVINYTIVADSGWITPSDSAGSTPGLFTVLVASNSGGSSRTGHVVVDSVGGGSARTITIAQEGHDTIRPLVTVIAPNGGETLGIGSTQNIRWTQSDNVGVTLDSLSFSGDGGTTYNNIWTGLADSFLTVIPNEPTVAGLIKVVAYDATGNRSEDVSNATFTIRDLTPPTVTVTAPMAGATWSAGSSRTITWTQSDNVVVAADSVHYSADNGATWIPLYGGAAVTSYSWTVPGINSSQCLVRVTAYDAPFMGFQNFASDTSGIFTIRDSIPPTVTVTAPNTGLSLMGGTAYEVRWNKGDNIGVTQDSLLYSTNGGASWSFIWKGLSASGTYSWTVPNTPSTACKVKAVVSDEAGNRAEDASDVDFTITAASLPYLAVSPTSINAPSGGSTDSITVTNTGNSTVLNYTVSRDSAWLSYNPASGTTPGKFAIVTAGNSSGFTRTGHVTVDTVGGGSARTITITQPSQDATAPAVALTAPNGGETWGIGSIQLIHWGQSDNVGVIRDTLQYSTDNGANWTFLWAGLDTSFYWTVPSTPTTVGRMRVIARDAAGNRSVDSSDAAFTIRDMNAPTATLTSPNGGEIWYTGSSHTVTWTQSDDIGVTADSVLYSVDNGTSWMPAYSGAATTSYSWTVPNTPSGACLVRVVAMDAAGNRTADASNAVFQISDNVAPTITVTAPNGGESWPAGSAHAIAWSQSDNVGVVSDSIYFSSDSMISWSPVAATAAATSFNWTVPAVVSNACFVKLVALDAGGNKASDISNAKFAVTMPDTEKPRLYTTATDTARMSRGYGFNFKVYASDNVRMNKVKLAWGAAGYTVLSDSVSMWATSDSTYFYPLDGSLIPQQGLQYRITAYDSAGNAQMHPASGYYIHQVYNMQLTHPVDYDRWKMVSFPADLNNMAVYALLQDDLGNYDRTKWRLYEYQTNQYVEYGAAGLINHLGRAYWLRQRVGQSATVDVDSAGSVAPSGTTVDVSFTSGWVDVGDPFLFAVKWSDIYAATGADTALIQGIYTYSGSSWTFPVTGNMAPWEGYSLRTSGSGTLRIPAIVATKAGADGKGWPQGWIGKITVVTGEGSDDNYFGIGEGTSAAADKYDYPEPPSGLTGVSGYFTLTQGEYGSDIRPILGAGQTWEFAAVSRSSENTITVQLPENLPKDVTVHLADLTDQVSQQMANGATYPYRAAANEKRCFKLIVGSGAYTAAELERAFLPPAVTLLAQNRPNPMTDKTTINYQLAAGGKVDLAVYNIVGQKVRTLVSGAQKPGKYHVTWDGSSDRGTRLSNGVYFFRLTASDAVQTKKLTIVR